MSYYVYMLASRPGGTLYIGVTGDLVRRTWEHRSGAVPGFTRRYGVSRLVWFEIFDDVTLAIKREKTLKHWLRAWKIALIERATQPGATCTRRSQHKYGLGPRVKPEDDSISRASARLAPTELQRLLERDPERLQQFLARPLLAVDARDLLDPADPPEPRLLDYRCRRLAHAHRLRASSTTTAETRVDDRTDLVIAAAVGVCSGPRRGRSQVDKTRNLAGR
jgi:putative endonuclease